MAKDEGYPELQLVISDFVDILIDFYPKEAMDLLLLHLYLSER